MDLKAAWKNLDAQKLSKPVQGTVSIPSHSKHPAAKLIQTFGLGLIFCIAFELMFVYLLMIMDQPIVKFGLAAIIIVYAFLFVINLNVWKRLRKLYRSDDPIRNVLEDVHKVVTTTLEFQRKLSWGFFPLCVAGGFLVGLSIEKDAATLIVKPVIYLTLLATIIIVTPLCYFLTKWMTRLAYGKYLKQIEDLLSQLKAD